MSQRRQTEFQNSDRVLGLRLVMMVPNPVGVVEGQGGGFQGDREGRVEESYEFIVKEVLRKGLEEGRGESRLTGCPLRTRLELTLRGG